MNVKRKKERRKDQPHKPKKRRTANEGWRASVHYSFPGGFFFSLYYFKKKTSELGLVIAEKEQTA